MNSTAAATSSSSTVEASVDVPVSGRWGVWLGGAYRDRLEADVDGRRIAIRRNHLEHFGEYTQLGELELAPGTHTVTLRYGGADLRPGSGGPQFEMGPLVLSRTTADLPVTYVRPAQARTLCGNRLDWVEALGSG